MRRQRSNSRNFGILFVLQINNIEVACNASGEFLPHILDHSTQVFEEALVFG
jgi:hypothetical protein